MYCKKNTQKHVGQASWPACFLTLSFFDNTKGKSTCHRPLIITQGAPPYGSLRASAARRLR